MRIRQPDAERVPMPAGSDELMTWVTAVHGELTGCNLVGVVAAPLNAIAANGGQNPMVPQAVVQMWQAQDPTLLFQAESLVKSFFKAACPALMRANIDVRLPYNATASDWFTQIVLEIQTLRSSTYDVARRKEAAFKVATDGQTNLEVVVAIWVAMANMVALYASANANLPASHWVVFLVYHLTATSLWLPDMEGLDQAQLNARAVQVANGKDNRDESVNVNYAAAAVTVGWITASVSGAANRASGVFKCLWHGDNATHATEDCREMQNMVAERRGGGSSAGNAKSGDRDHDVTCNTCGNTGHRTRRCPQAICNECSAKGHIKRDCPVLKAKKAKGKKTKQGATAMAGMFKQFEAFMKTQAASGGDDGADSDSESVCSNASHRSAAGGHMAITAVDDAAHTGDAGDGDYTWGVGGH